MMHVPDPSDLSSGMAAGRPILPDRIGSRPPNTVYVITLPCKILSHNFIHVHFYLLFQKCYPLLIIAIFSNFHKHNF